LRWAEQAWAHLTDARLTEYDGPLGRCRAYIRFLVLASIYRDWCALVWDEIHDDSAGSWLATIDDVSPIHIGQLLRPDDDVSDNSQDALDEALNVLMQRQRTRVVAAVINGFGGVDGLFLSLWRSIDDPNQKTIVDDDDDDQEHVPETDAEILNDVTPEKLAGYQWIMQGCETLGPIRSPAEMDD
jgi:hypothetical protein